MRVVSIRLEEDVLKKVDALTRGFGFSSRSEFIRFCIMQFIMKYYRE